jgi:hypothetical protein
MPPSLVKAARLCGRRRYSRQGCFRSVNLALHGSLPGGRYSRGITAGARHFATLLPQSPSHSPSSFLLPASTGLMTRWRRVAAATSRCAPHSLSVCSHPPPSHAALQRSGRAVTSHLCCQFTAKPGALSSISPDSLPRPAAVAVLGLRMAAQTICVIMHSGNGRLTTLRIVAKHGHAMLREITFIVACLQEWHSC